MPPPADRVDGNTGTAHPQTTAASAVLDLCDVGKARIFDLGIEDFVEGGRTSTSLAAYSIISGVRVSPQSLLWWVLSSSSPSSRSTTE
jgi:hypothetical protein